MAWRAAYSLSTLREQLNTMYPDRSKLSDGMIGDAAHASTVSQHNPNAAGVVTAFDITHDPAHGVDGTALANDLIKDFRTWYVIWNNRIWEVGVGWRSYSGVDPHTSHVHISTKQDAATYDNNSKWNLTGGNMVDEEFAKVAQLLMLNFNGSPQSIKELMAFKRPVDVLYALDKAPERKIQQQKLADYDRLKAENEALKLGATELKPGKYIVK